MAKDRIAFIGENYDGESDRVMDGANLLVMPGLIDIHSHPFSEPMNKGMWDEVGSRKLYNTSLYEYLPILNPDEEGVKASYGVALSEVLMSGVTTLCDLSLPTGRLARHSRGLRACGSASRRCFGQAVVHPQRLRCGIRS